jgi:multicomponent Na+:H+ antiporter subunit F
MNAWAANDWAVAMGALLPAFAVAVLAGLRGVAATRLAAFVLATGLAAMLLVLMSFAFAQPAYIDLALAVTILNVPGTLLIAKVLERWL